MTPDATPRRILMTADAVGGVWNYALELAGQLGRREIEVILAVMGPPPRADQAAAAAELRNVTLCVSPFRLEWMEDPWADVRHAGTWLLQLERDFAPDLVHLNGYAHGVLPWFSPVLMVGHSCVISWWESVRGEIAPATWDPYRAAVRAGLQAAHEVVAPSYTMLLALQRLHGPLLRTAVIPNTCDAQRFVPGPKEPFVLGAGRWWDEAKNVAALARVAPDLPWPVHLAGEISAVPPRPTELDTVQLLGRCPPAVLAGHFARAGIFALPARYEPFGLAVLEAATAGCALVLGDIPSLRENWDGAAAFVPPNEPDLLRRTLLQLIADEGRRLDLGHRARTRAARFTADRFVDGYLAAYARCLTTTPAEPSLA